jgi:hypothetical protein
MPVLSLLLLLLPTPLFLLLLLCPLLLLALLTRRVMVARGLRSNRDL